MRLCAVLLLVAFAQACGGWQGSPAVSAPVAAVRDGHVVFEANAVGCRSAEFVWIVTSGDYSISHTTRRDAVRVRVPPVGTRVQGEVALICHSSAGDTILWPKASYPYVVHGAEDAPVLSVDPATVDHGHNE